MKRFLLIFLFSGLVLLAKAQTDLGAAAFKSALETEKNELLVDVRQTWEVKQGRIAGSVNYDWLADGFMANFKTVPKDKPIYVYCAVGGRSSEAAAALSKAGYKKVYNLTGGYKGWEKAGYPVTK